MLIQRIWSQVSDVLSTKKYILGFYYHSQLKLSVICTPPWKDTGLWNLKDVRMRNKIELFINLLLVKEDGSSCHLPAWFTSHRRYHSLSYSTAYQINKAGNTLTLETEGNKEDTKLECLNMKSETNSTALFTVMSVTSW